VFQVLLDHREVAMMAGKGWDHGVWVHLATGQEFDKTCKQGQKIGHDKAKVSTSPHGG